MLFSIKIRKTFIKNLLSWADETPREMPWRGAKDPYTVWLSEIILQQTRMEQGLPYFQKFIKKYPSVSDLAQADEDAVFKLWQGLGYYSRARNLHLTAKEIAHNQNATFPKSFQELLKLKGVGNYTAAAIASFCFGENKAVVDGNVIRVLARVVGIQEPFDTAAGKKIFQQLADELIQFADPALFNQALMDFGATQCKPQKPLCTDCPMQSFCFALQHNLQTELPVKSKKIVLKNRFFYYFLIKNQHHIYLQKRTKKDIWQGLYEFPLIESDKKLSHRQIIHTISKQFPNAQLIEISPEITQLLSHQKIHFLFIELSFSKKKVEKDWIYVSLEKLNDYAFPQTINLFLKGKKII